MDGWSIFSGNEPRGAFITYTFVFGSSTFFALAPVGVYLGHQAIGKTFWKESQMNWWSTINAGVVVSMAALIGGTLFTFVSIFNEFQWYSDPSTPRRQGVVICDVDCITAHAYLSEWRYYLDIDRYNRPMRIVKMWLNA